MRKKSTKKLEKLPDSPGIYLFYNTNKELVYVGKATSLKSRVKSYFRLKKVTRPIEHMMSEVSDIKWKKTESVLEAVIEESIYIKKYQPKYNILGKDNKSWNYIVISKDKYPIVATKREHELAVMKREDSEKLGNYMHIFGPYPGLNGKAAMNILRRLFIISDCQKRKLQIINGAKQMKPCFYYQMGQCLGVCVGKITPKEYREKVIRPLVLLLSGKKKLLIKKLKHDMYVASKKENYEEAGRMRDQLKSLLRIHDVALLNKNYFQTEAGGPLAGGLKSANSELRIEGYDISNLGVTGKVGSMVVFSEFGSIKSQYRKFKIKTVVGQSDVECLEEMLRRRLKHLPERHLERSSKDEVERSHGRINKQWDSSLPLRMTKGEWPKPDVILIDGGIPQVNRAVSIVREHKLKIPVVGIAKGFERKKNEFVFGFKNRDFIKWVNSNQTLLIQARDEAHRFALAYQRKLRKI